MNAKEELAQIAERLEALARRGDNAEIADPLSSLQESAERVGRSASGSWLGYHAFVYYEGLNRPPPDAHFDQEWGLMDRPFSNRTSGSWLQYTRETVEAAIYGRAGDPDLGPARAFNDAAREAIELCKSEISSILQTHMPQDDQLLKDIKGKVEDAPLVDREDVISEFAPRSTWVSRDHLAINQGQQTPPHIHVWAETVAINHTRGIILRMIKLVQQATSHVSRQQAVSRPPTSVGTKIFIGHGRSAAWHELKDFIKEQLGLPTDEFNSEPTAGRPTFERLEQMLSSAAVAFLVMTAEDEQRDGKSHPRLNVVHETGLFQGRLGPERAIILLEEGCEEFSNIAGLGQLRFPKGKIKVVFAEVMRTLEQVGLLKANEAGQGRTE